MLTGLQNGNLPVSVQVLPWFWGLRFCRGRRKGSAFKNLAGALHTDRAGCMLSAGRRVKKEFPVNVMLYRFVCLTELNPPNFATGEEPN